MCTCYTYHMAKNVTLALDEWLVERARDYAQARDLTLNSLIRQLLTDAVAPSGTTGPETTFRLIDEAQPRGSMGKWRREDLYGSRLDRLK
jgi:hypothetical protein